MLKFREPVEKRISSRAALQEIYRLRSVLNETIASADALELKVDEIG
jgi:hypothetical protein